MRLLKLFGGAPALAKHSELSKTINKQNFYFTAKEKP